MEPTQAPILACRVCSRHFRAPQHRPGKQYRCRHDGSVLVTAEEFAAQARARPAEGPPPAHKPAAAPASRPSNPRLLWRIGAGVAALVLVSLGAWAVPAILRRSPEPAATASAAAVDAPDTFPTEIRPLLKQYCYSCHGPKHDQLNLKAYETTDQVKRDRDAWLKVLTKLHLREMPPNDEPQPSIPEHDKLTGWIETTFNALDYSGPPDPGHVTLRRLTRTEYRNTIRDLLGVDLPVAAELPADDVGYGFDNIGDVLTLPPMLLEKYLGLARDALDRVALSPAPPAPKKRSIPGARMEPTGAGSSPQGNAMLLMSETEVRSTVEFPQDGEYVLKVRASADQAGPDTARMAVRLEGKDLKTFDVKALRAKPEVYEITTKVARGKRPVGVAFLNDYFEPRHKDPKLRGDRNLHLVNLEVVGPILPASPETEATYRRIFGDDKEPRQILSRFATRAFRRPAADDEVARYVALYESIRKQDTSAEEAAKTALQAILVSPHFLFHVETSADKVRELDPYELASRLSYFLWSSMPDDELWAQARTGALKQPAVLEAQARRMLRDERARALAENFAPQWLQIRRLQAAAPDPKLFPSFDEPLREAMQREAVLFFDAILREDRSLLELFDADFTFLNERLARHYGIDGVTGDEFRRVKLSDGARGGVLTMGAVLTATSDPTRTSPVKRGKWVMESVLGTPPPPPLPDAAVLKDDPAEAAGLTMRQRMERHRADPNCATCHRRMDPLGFGFENYDAIGAWRDQENGKPIDTSATLPDGRAFRGPAELKKLLLAQKEEMARGMIKKLLTYALGRGIEYYDGPTIQSILKSTQAQNYSLSKLVIEVARCYPFRYRR
jgi:hypothetical protein